MSEAQVTPLSKEEMRSFCDSVLITSRDTLHELDSLDIPEEDKPPGEVSHESIMLVLRAFILHSRARRSFDPSLRVENSRDINANDLASTVCANIKTSYNTLQTLKEVLEKEEISRAELNESYSAYLHSACILPGLVSRLKLHRLMSRNEQLEQLEQLLEMQPSTELERSALEILRRELQEDMTWTDRDVMARRERDDMT